MNELVTFVDVVEKIGIPALFFVIAGLCAFKYFPAWQKTKEEEKKDQQEYYRDRQKAYDTQMGIVTTVVEQNNEIIRMNTAAINANTAVHEKVTTALNNDLYALRELKAVNEKINVGVEKLLDRGE